MVRRSSAEANADPEQDRVEGIGPRGQASPNIAPEPLTTRARSFATATVALPNNARTVAFSDASSNSAPHLRRTQYRPGQPMASTAEPRGSRPCVDSKAQANPHDARARPSTTASRLSFLVLQVVGVRSATAQAMAVLASTSLPQTGSRDA